MAITRQQRVPKVKIPAANIYLDDLEEIINILKPEGEDQPPRLEFSVNDMLCDSIDDLQKLGGRTSRFKMNVTWKKGYGYDEIEFSRIGRVEVWVSGSGQRRTWVRHQLADIFKRRVRSFGKAPWLVMAVTFVAYLLVFEGVMYFVHKIAGREGPLHWVIVVLSGGLAGYFVFPRVYESCIRSVVILQRYSEEKGGWFNRHHDQITLAVVTSLISGVIGAAIALFVQKILR